MLQLAGLVKVAAGGASGRPPDLGSPVAVGDEVDDTLLSLEGPGDAKERRRLGENSVPLEDARPEDDVHEPGLVLNEGKRASV